VRQQTEVPPSLLLGKAVGYSLAKSDKLVKYLESFCLTPDNIAHEKTIRPFVLGLANWILCPWNTLNT
jgi:transposase